jgi:hypothetical protein
MTFSARSALRSALAVLALGGAAALPLLPASATTTDAATTGSVAPGAVGTCAASQLHIHLGQAEGTAGSTYHHVRFLNTGAKACTLDGFPRFVYLDSSGDRVGFPAKHEGRHHRVTIRPGEVAVAALGIPDYLNFPSSRCHAERTAKVSVRAPGTDEATRLKLKAKVCTTKFGRSISLAVKHHY